MKFETGKTYFTRSICDYDCIHQFEILKRTEKSVWVQVDGKVSRRAIEIHNGIESFFPFGKYSMAAMISADCPVEVAEVVEAVEEAAHVEPAAPVVEEICKPVEPYFVTAKAAVCNKQDGIAEYIEQVEKGDYRVERYKVCYEVKLSYQDWNKFCSSLLSNKEWLSGKGGTSSSFDCGRDIENIWDLTESELQEWKRGAYSDECVLVSNGWHSIVIDPQGYSYARYVGIDVQKEQTAKPARHLSIVA